jgi:hypothetical protein
MNTINIKVCDTLSQLAKFRLIWSHWGTDKTYIEAAGLRKKAFFAEKSLRFTLFLAKLFCQQTFFFLSHDSSKVKCLWSIFFFQQFFLEETQQGTALYI